MKLTIAAILLWMSFYAVNSAAQTTATMDKSKNYSVEIIRYTIVEEQRGMFEEAYRKAGVVLQSSPYCLGYEIIRGIDEPQRYIVRIHWTSKEDHLQGFRQSKEFGSFFNLVKPFYSNIDEMKHYIITPTIWSKYE
jgi:heme-degrading monooxygenase HmoA